MAAKPQAQTTAILPAVAGQDVPTAQGNLRPFSNVSWIDTNGRSWSPPPSTYSVIPEPVGGRNPEEPSALIGRSVPTDTAIVITIRQ